MNTILKHTTVETNWAAIATEPLTEEFIMEFSEHLDWTRLCVYQKLTENFIRENKDRVNWNCIALFQNFSDEFCVEFEEKLPKNILKMRYN